MQSLGWLAGPARRLEEIRCGLEELRISRFAQPQPATQPVAVRRIAKRWLELGL